MSLHPKLSELTNDPMVGLINTAQRRAPKFRDKVSGVIVQLENRDENPRIYETKRNLAQQKEKVRLGYSKTLASEHLKKGNDGGAMACDIADAVKGWNATRRFWFIMGAASQSYGIGWGGLFGLSRNQKAKLVKALDELRAAKFPMDHPAYRTEIGFDPAHLQARNNW